MPHLPSKKIKVNFGILKSGLYIHKLHQYIHIYLNFFNQKFMQQNKVVKMRRKFVFHV